MTLTPRPDVTPRRSEIELAELTDLEELADRVDKLEKQIATLEAYVHDRMKAHLENRHSRDNLVDGQWGS